MKKTVSILLTLALLLGAIGCAPFTAAAAKTESDSAGALPPEFAFCFVNTLHWEHVYLYAWDTEWGRTLAEWPGVEMTRIYDKTYGDEEVYRYVMDWAPTGFIFNDGENTAQTVDIAFDYYVEEAYYLSGEIDEDSQHYTVTPCTLQSPHSGDCLWEESGFELSVFGWGAMKDYDTPADSPMDPDTRWIHIHNGVTGIGTNAFARMQYLNLIILPDTLNALPDNALPTGSFTAWVRSGSLAEQVLQNKENVTLYYLSAMGDVNSDGKVNINDVTFLQRCLANLEWMSGDQLACADIDGSGSDDPTINDATMLQAYLAEYPVVPGRGFEIICAA